MEYGRMNKDRMNQTEPDRLRRQFLQEVYRIPPAYIALLDEAEYELREAFASVDERADYNQLRLLHCFQRNGVTDFHLNGSTGYGYGDTGREALEAVFAAYFCGEQALVRNQIVSGTHALALGLYGNLKSGDALISAAGQPYDTLQSIIGLHGEADSLLASGVTYREIPLKEEGAEGIIDLPRLLDAVNEKTKLILLQRSKGYQWRPSLSLQELENVISALKAKKGDLLCLVDNCYCEMTETREPGDAGADLTIGSLIKNPGGTLAPCGGYIVGTRSCVEACVRRLYAPGLRSDMGATLEFNRLAFQGLSQAPQTVGQSMKGAMLAGAFFHRLGYAVMPPAVQTGSDETILGNRADIVQAVRLEEEAKLIRFCQGIQQACPVNAAFLPEPDRLPGYDCPIVMAGGGFIQGSSSELSADGPLRPPYIAYLQGGFSLAQIRLGLLLAAKALQDTLRP
ncbi:MAG: methionine gamma-lyase family protein [Clostridiales bacterium]|nr:methionine gamma-lyase family protein [Clostridiales bacterium]